MRKILVFIALLIAAALVCGCSVPFLSTSAPKPTQTAVIPDQQTDEPTYTPIPIPSVQPPTATPRASQSVAVSDVDIHWTTNAGTESDTVTYNITNDGAQTLTSVTAKYEVDTFLASIDPVLGEIDSQMSHTSTSSIGTLTPDQSKIITMTLSGGGQNGAYSNELPENSTLTINWDGGSKVIFHKKMYQNPPYSNGDMTVTDADVYVAPPTQTGVVN